MTESGTSAASSDFLPRLHLLAVELLLGKASVVDDAVALACDLVVAEGGGPGTIEVASLYRDTTLADSRALLDAMLNEHGIDFPPFTTEEEQFAVRRTAFGFWNLPLSDFEGEFYAQISEWDSQSSFDRQIVILLDQLDSEAQPERRAALVERMREVARTADFE